MSINIIGIAGNGYGCGKNEVAGIVKSFLPEYEIRGFADKVKQIAAILIGEEYKDTQEYKASYLANVWNFYKKSYTIVNGEWEVYEDIEPMTVRAFLQRLGVGLRETLHNDCWVTGLFNNHTKDSKWLLVDTRFRNEVLAIKNRGGIIIKVTRDSIVQDSHISENALEGYVFDYEISNNGTKEELQEQVKIMLEHFKLLIWNNQRV